MKKNFEENYANFVFTKVLGLEKDSEKCEQKWKEINTFYDTVCDGDFIEKFIYVSIFFSGPERSKFFFFANFIAVTNYKRE
jgi:hypothetical protein